MTKIDDSIYSEGTVVRAWFGQTVLGIYLRPRLGRLTGMDRLSSPLQIAIVVVLVMIATLIRGMLDSALHLHLPYVTYFVAVAACAWIGGYKAALMATALGFFSAWYFFVPYKGSFLVAHNAFLAGFFMYFTVTLAFVCFAGAMHWAQQKADKHAEYLSTTLESIGDGIIVTNSNLEIVEMNPAAEHITGYCAAKMLGQPLSRVLNITDEQTREPILSPTKRALETGETDTTSPETLLLRADGSEIPISLSVAAIRSDSPIGTGCVLVLHDTTESRQLQRENAEKTLVAERMALDLAIAGRRKNEFLAMLAHELRNPLAPIRTAAELLQNPALDSNAVLNSAQVVEQQVIHLARLVDDLLDFNRIEKGKVTLQKAPVTLEEITNAAVEMTRPEIDRANLSLTVTGPPDAARITISTDQARVAQIIGNLLHNATKFTAAGGNIKLNIDYDNEMLTIEVIDDGIGLAEDRLTDIFDMFVQVDTSLGRSTIGAGMGLSIIRHLTELFGGSVKASSPGLGQGSTFIVRVPAEQVENNVETPVDKIGPGGKILIVDDNREYALIMSALLRLKGFDVETEFDGLAALSTSETFQPDVILLDIGLPSLDGYQVCERIRHAPWGASIMIVAVSGWAYECCQNKSQATGFDAHLTKPVNHQEIIEIIESRSHLTDRKTAI